MIIDGRGEIVGAELLLRDGQGAAKHRLRVGGEALLEPCRAGIVEGSDEAGIVGRHGLLRDRERAVEDRRRLARTSLLAVEESELAEAAGESEVRIAEDLGLLHRVEIAPLGIGDLAAVQARSAAASCSSHPGD